MEKRRFKATINGKTYILVGNYSQEHLHHASQLTQQQLAQIMRLSPELDSEQAAILLALNTVSMQMQLEQELLKLRKRVSKLEYELLDAKHSERVLQRGMTHHIDDNVAGEQLSIEEFNVGFSKKIQTVDEEYTPAIFKKEGHNS